jgi:hypothetical protein
MSVKHLTPQSKNWTITVRVEKEFEATRRNLKNARVLHLIDASDGTQIEGFFAQGDLSKKFRFYENGYYYQLSNGTIHEQTEEKTL